MGEKGKVGDLSIDAVMAEGLPAWDAHIKPPYSCNEATRKFIELAGVPGWAESGVDVFTALRDVWMRHVNDKHYDCVIADGLNVTGKVSVECAKCGDGLFGGVISTPNLSGPLWVPHFAAGIDITCRDGKFVSRDGREIYGLKTAARKFLELAGIGPKARSVGHWYLDAAMKQLSEYRIRHIRTNDCDGGWFFVELDDISRIIDVECSACGASLKTVNLG